MNPTVRLARLVLSDPDRAWSEAQRIDDASKAKRKRVLERSKPRRAKEKVEDQIGNAKHLGLVSLALTRADGWCELCCFHLDGHRELHHLEGGPAKTKNERLSNVMIVHPSCHAAYHMNVAAFVPRVKRWCDMYDYRYPQRKEYR